MPKRKYFFDYICLFISVFCLFCMFLFPGVVKNTVLYSLKVCVYSLIPSLFPFIICTRLMLLYLTHTKKRGANKRYLAGTSSTALYSFTIGLISGFPTGAIVSGQMYKSGIINIDEAEKIAVYSSVASPAFCINFLGYEILNSRIYGLIIYLACVISSIILFIISNFISYKKSIHYVENISRETSSVTEIITDSGITMLSICAFITYFMCVGKVIVKVLFFIFENIKFIEPYILGTFEMTSGIATLVSFDFSSRLLTASLIVGFGGLSAIMQVYGICKKNGLICKNFIPVKIMSAIITPIVTFTIISLYNFAKNQLTFNFGVIIKILILLFFIGILIFIRKKAGKTKKNKVNL